MLDKQLLKLTQSSLEYGNILECIEDWQNVLVDNTEKYKDKINEINSYYPNKNFDLLRSFSNRTCRNYQKKVDKELNIFEYRFRFLDVITDEMQHLIKQIKENHEYTERENDRNQNITIFAAATGIATAEIANSNFGEIKNIPYYKMLLNEEFIYRFLCSFLFGCVVGFCIWIAYMLVKYYGSSICGMLKTLFNYLKSFLSKKI